MTSLRKDDPFGYVMQGFLYAESVGYLLVDGSLSNKY